MMLRTSPTSSSERNRPFTNTVQSAGTSVIDNNAQIIAYAHDFLFMFFISLPALLVVFLMKKPPALGQLPQPAETVME